MQVAESETSGQSSYASIAAKVRAQLILRMLGVHLIGALFIFAYLQQLYPASQAFDTPWLNDVGLLVFTEVCAGPVLWLWVRAEFRRSSRWADEERLPDDDERRRILLEPFRMAARPYLIWLIGTVTIAGLSTVRGRLTAEAIADTAQIMLIGGFATCAISYLIIEQIYRPLFAVALSSGTPNRPSSLGIRPRLMLAWATSSGIPLLGLALAPVRQTGTSMVPMAVLAGIGLLSGVFATAVAANSIAEPLDELRDALGRVARGDLDGDLQVDDGGEVGQVQAGFNRMVGGLREREQLEDLFSRHVGQEVATQALERGPEPDLGGEQRRCSVIFVDIIGSTAMSEVLPPGEVVSTLNAFFRTVVDTVNAEGGWVNKFEGDGALCVFGVPGFQPDHEQRALRAARLLQQRLAVLAEDHPGLDAGVGVSSGVVVAGNVGSEERYEYTVIGRAVNEAARLTELAKQRSGRLLASAATVRAAGPEQAHWIDRGNVGLRGQQVPTAVYELRAGISRPVLPRPDGR